MAALLLSLEGEKRNKPLDGGVGLFVTSLKVRAQGGSRC